MHRRFDECDITNKLKDPPGIYRFSSVGKALREAVDDLRSAGKIGLFLETHILKTFDIKMAQVFSRFAEEYNWNTNVRKSSIPPLIFRAEKISSYKTTDGCWQFKCENVMVNLKSPVTVKELTLLADNYSNKSLEQKKIIRALTRNYELVAKGRYFATTNEDSE